MHLAVARRGAFIEYDWIGVHGSDESYIENIHRVLDAGFGGQLLLSQDRGWYDPALPKGGTPKPYTYLHDVFLPKLAASGVDVATIGTITRDNPFRAFAR
jgi:phosphotriesterase-related protein